ncbi:MAG: DUF6547 family protein [Pseudomonadota bacterium]
MTYEDWLDEFVRRAAWCLSADRVRKNGHTVRTNDDARPLEAEEAEARDALLSMNHRQREIVVSLLERERSAAFHDALALLEEQTANDDIDIRISGKRIEGSPYASFHYDFVCRSDGDDWPDRKGD